MSRQTYEAAVALNNIAVALLFHHQYRYAMSVFQEAMNLVKSISAAKCLSKGQDQGTLCPNEKCCCIALHDCKIRIRNIVSKAEQSLSMPVFDRIHRSDVVVLNTGDMNPDFLIHSCMSNEINDVDFVVSIMKDEYIENEKVEEDVEVLTNLNVHAAIILCNYAVACKRCLDDDRITRNIFHFKKMNESSIKIFQLSYAILQNELEYLPSLDQVSDENEQAWQFMSCVYCMNLLVLYYLAHLNNRSTTKSAEHGLILHEIDRLARNYSFIHGMMCNATYGEIGSLAAAPIA
jgi:hypothetical protein